jgi:hypothetical protein
MQLRKEDALDDSTLYFIGKSLFCSFGDMVLQEALLWTANLEQKSQRCSKLGHWYDN